MSRSIFDSAEFNRNLFFPRPDYGATPGNAEDLFVPVEDGVAVHVRIHPNPGARFSLLYFHGNGEIVSDYDELSPVFSALGGEFIVCEYRGYGKSGGIPTLKDALEDATRIYEFLGKQQKLQKRVGVMGRSLGSASAIELCARFAEISACVIESGYADPIPLVQRRGLQIGETTPEEDALYNNSRKIRNVKCPLLIMHGAEDFLIEPHEAELNFENAGSENKELEILQGVGHNDILFAPDNLYFKTLGGLLAKTYPEQ